MATWIGWRYASRLKSIPCPTWLAWMVERDNPFSKINRAPAIIENSHILPGMAVLDAGCGPGRLTIPTAQAVGPQGKVVAMDIQAGMLEKVEKKAKDLKNIEFLHAGLGENKLAANQFDRALLVTVIGEIPDQNSALEEIFNALKPNGILSITEIIFDPHYQSKDSILQAASSVGFQEKGGFEDWASFTLLLEKPRANY